MAVSLNKCNTGRPDKEKEYFRAVVRLAAIFHDTGHMFLSHVSEHYFAKSSSYPRYKQINDMLEKFEKCAKKEAALHELLGCMMVNSAAVRDLIVCAARRLNGIELETEDDLNRLVEYISGLIVGVPVDCAVLPYSSIINGPIDADKCDYLSRDSHVTHVPVAVDISRLTQKLSVVETKEINKSELWHMESEISGPYYELAMFDSAEKALFQLCIARTIMFDSVYYHHKVLTAETELRELVSELANLEEPVFTSFLEILEYTDDDFNKYFFQQLKTVRTAADIKRIEKIQTGWERIYHRNMAKRIACIMPEYLEGTQSARERLFDDVLTSLNAPAEKLLLAEIQKEYKEICLLIQSQEPSLEDVRVFIIQSPTNVFEHSKIQVPIDMYNGRKREFRGYELVSSRETSSSASHFVAAADNRYFMYLALEKVLYQRYKIILKDECRACGKFSSKEEMEYGKKLLEAGYYDTTPELIRDNLLYNYISTAQIRTIRDKFLTYDGPNGYTIEETDIEYFFKQVLCACKKKKQGAVLARGIYQLLLSSVLVDRKFVVQNISKALNDLALPDQELKIVPLGSPKDSAKHLMYYFNDIRLKGKKIIVKEKLEEVLEDEDSVIIFFDDGSYSGKQLCCIMQEYMGVLKSERVIKENHVQPLDDSMKCRLKEKTIIYLFLMFNVKNQANTENKLREIGLNNVKFAYPNGMDQKKLEQSGIFESDAQQRMVTEFLRDVGIEILNSQKKINGTYKDNWSEERVIDSALGYNNAQQMVILKDSVPTYTITAFWQEGQYGELEWRPLFKRTIKED